MSIKITNSIPINLIGEENNFNENPKTTEIALQILDGTTNHWITQGNIERIGWSSLSVASAASSIASYIFYTTIAAAAGSAVAALLPPSLMTAAGLFAWNAYMTPNYDSKAEVAKYREEAKSLSLEETLSRHGRWTYDRKILSQEQVTQKYIEKESSFKGLPAKIAYHNKIETCLKLSNTSSVFTVPNPLRLKEEIKKECANLSFQEIKDLHSIELLFAWNLLTPSQFSQKYKTHAWHCFNSKGISAVISEYKITCQALKSKDYTIPHPKSFNTMWMKQKNSLEEIVMKQNVDDLIIYEILQDASFISSLKKLEQEFKQNETSFIQKKLIIENTFNREFSRAQSQYNNQVEIARIAFASSISIQAQRNMRVSFLERELIKARQHNDIALIHSLTSELDYARSEKFLSTLSNISNRFLLEQRVSSAKKYFDEEVMAIRSRKTLALEPITNDYLQNKKALERKYSEIKPKSFF